MWSKQNLSVGQTFRNTVILYYKYYIGGKKPPIIKSNKQNIYSEFPLVSTKYIKIDKIRVVANKITLFYHNKAPSEFIVTFQAPFFIRATSENYEPNYEALQVEYCWNHWYFSLSSLCKSYAPKKYYPSANGECGVYIVERRGTSVVWIGSFDWWQTWSRHWAQLVLPQPNEGSVNENRSMSIGRQVYLRFSLVFNFPFFFWIRFLLISIKNVTAECQRE